MKLIILRGIPGAGKSTFIRRKYSKAVVASADHFFEVDGEYHFQPHKIGEAHGECFRNACAAAQAQVPLIVIDNTATSAVEVAPYVLLGQAYGYDVQIVTLLVDVNVAAARNVHDVPLAAIKSMDKNLRNAEFPPWWSHTIYTPDTQ